MATRNSDVPESRIKIQFQVGGKNHKLFPDISDEEMFAIGRITISWAYLEHIILLDCVQMAEAH